MAPMRQFFLPSQPAQTYRMSHTYGMFGLLVLRIAWRFFIFPVNAYGPIGHLTGPHSRCHVTPTPFHELALRCASEAVEKMPPARSLWSVLRGCRENVRSWNSLSPLGPFV